MTKINQIERRMKKYETTNRLSKTKYMTDTTLLSILQEKQMGLPSTYQVWQRVNLFIF